MIHKLCAKTATHREPLTGHSYCADHALDIADIFGYDRLDLIQANKSNTPPAC
jgi:hypothetical protein